MADGTQAWWASADACQGASDRLLTWSGHELSDGMHEARTCLKLTVEPQQHQRANERRRSSTCIHDTNGRDGQDPACQSEVWVRALRLQSGSLSR